MQDIEIVYALKKQIDRKMKNWKFDLFTFKQNLTLDQLDIAQVVDKHLYHFDKMSEKELTQSLKEHLKPYEYDTDVKALFESFDEELQSQSLLYGLKDLYKKVEKKNYGMLYRQPLVKILEIITKDDDEARMEAILNDLVIYDWVPEIKVFNYNLISDPTEKRNLISNGAKSSKVFTVVESVEDGNHVAFIGDRWFLLTEDTISQCVLGDYVQDQEKLKVLESLGKAMTLSGFENDAIDFRIDENITISVNVNGKLYINGEETDKETTLEDLFNSPIIPYMKKNFYHVIESVSSNLDKVIELDIAAHITSLAKPMTEIFAFNYKDKMYLYSIDKRKGSSLFEYDSVNQLIQDVQREMGYDITSFFNSKLSTELKRFRNLEDREQQIEMKIKEVNESIDELKENDELMNESSELKAAFDELLVYKHSLVEQLNKVKNEKVQERKLQ